MMNKYRGTRITTVRALNAYGPRQTAAAPYGPSKVRKIMPSFICRALEGEPIEIYGDGTQIMDMIYVADVARVLVQALEVTDKSGPVLDVLEAGTGRETTVNEIAQVVAARVGTDTNQAVQITHLPMRPGEDEKSIVLGNPKTLEPIGLDGSDFVPLEDGVLHSVDYFLGYLRAQEGVFV